MTYTIIAGAEVVAKIHGCTERDERSLSWIAGCPGTVWGEAASIVDYAQMHARLRGEYVDVFASGRHIATVGPEGPAPERCASRSPQGRSCMHPRGHRGCCEEWSGPRKTDERWWPKAAGK